MNESIKNKKYSWYRDNKMIGTILLITISIMQICAFLKIPVLSTMHAYTIGMLFGFFNPFFYVYVAYLSLVLMFQEKIKLPKWVKLNHMTYWFTVVSLIFISTSTFYYQGKTSFTSIGSEPWNSFKVWYADFTSQSAWAPAQTNGGLIGVFLYSLSASVLSGIGSLILSITLAAISISLILTGTFIGLYKNIHNKRELEIKDEVAIEDKKMNFDNFIEPALKEDKQIKEEEIKHTVEKDDLPFEDPFA